MRSLQPLIFIPSDQAAAFRPAYVEALWERLGEVMRWFRQRIDRDVFQAFPVLEFVGSYRAHEYFRDTQDKVLHELSKVWGVGRDGHTYICYGLWDEGPYQAPGNVIGASGNYLVVQSNTSLDIFLNNCYPGYDPGLPWNNRLAQTGALAHELGHTLGLGHTADSEPALSDTSIMQAWWTYPRAGFTARELAALALTLGE